MTALLRDVSPASTTAAQISANLWAFVLAVTAEHLDRREVLLSLTPKGERILRELSLHHKAELRMRGPVLVSALKRAMQMGKSSNGIPAKASSPNRRKE